MILLVSPTGKYATHRLIEEAKKQHIPVAHFDVRDLAERNFNIDVEKYSTLYVRFPFPYIGQIVELAQKFVRAGKRVIDPSIARADVDFGKMKSYEMLYGSDIPTPLTLWFNEANFEYPYVVKWKHGFKGRHVYLVQGDADRARLVEKYDPTELLSQEFIRAEYEWKVITVGYKSLPVVLRFKISESGFKPDLAHAEVYDCHSKIPSLPAQGADAASNMQYSKFRKTRLVPENDYQPGFQIGVRDDTIKSISSLAESAAKITGRELAKVDILEAKGKFYVLEVNRWPGFESFESLSRYNVAKSFIEYLK